MARFDRAVAESGSDEREPTRLWMVRVAGEERPAIAADTPSGLRFPGVSIGVDARLVLGCGIAGGPRQSRGARFVVSVAESGAEPTTLWSLELRPDERPGDRGWHDVEIELSELAGKTVDILLTTEALEDSSGEPAAWSELVIRSGGEAFERSLVPVRRRVVVRDLIEDGGPTPESMPPPGRPCRRQFRLAVGDHMSLDLSAQVVRDREAPSGPLGPVLLRLDVDGRTMLRRRLSSSGSFINLSPTVPLDDYAGRVVDVEFELCDIGVGNALLWYERLWLTRMEETPRLSSTNGPNLLLLMVDTLRPDHLGLYGYARDTSPTLDRLGEESLVIDLATTHSSWTTPAVASILTGLAPLEHGLIEGAPLSTSAVTIGETLQEAGLTTLGVSANPLVGRLEGLHRGFETFLQIPWARAEHVNRIFLDWLADQGDVRWFAYLHYVDPHAPYAAPEPWRERYTDGCHTEYTRKLRELSLAVNFGRGSAEYGPDDVDCLRDGYDGEIRYWDDQLGRLMSALRQLGGLDDTVIIVTSDHGEEFFEHGKLGHGFHLYGESVGVPLVIRAPGRIEPRRRAGPVGTRHIAEAALWLLGSGPADGRGGPLLSERNGVVPQVFSHTTEAYEIGEGYTDLASMRDSRWKYILRPADGMEELYDLAADPAERSNRADQEPEVRLRYREELEKRLAAGRRRSPASRLDLETLERLNALGYIR